MAQDTRSRMVNGTARLVGTNGARATSLRDLAREAGVPLGSTYHHFPGGKQQLVEEAVRAVGAHIDRVIASSSAKGVDGAMRSLVEEWGSVLTSSGFHSGCAVLAVATEDDAELRRTATEVFESWRGGLTAVLVGAGVPKARAPRLARMIVASVEGAIALCRAERSLEPLDDVAEELRTLIRGAVGV